MNDVFISYSRSDKKIAEKVYRRLCELGYSVWMDNAIQPGEGFDNAIQDEISNAKVVIVLWSTKSIDSHWVRSEASIGLKNENLVSLLIDDCSPPVPFTNINHEILDGHGFKMDDPTWIKVVNRIEKLSGTLKPNSNSLKTKIVFRKISKSALSILIALAIFAPSVYFLDKYHTLLRPVRVEGLHTDLSQWNRGFVSAKGSWKYSTKHPSILYQNAMSEINVVSIECWKDDGSCSVSTAQYTPEYKNFSIDTVNYILRVWDGNVIVADRSWNNEIDSLTISRTSGSIMIAKDWECDGTVPEWCGDEITKSSYVLSNKEPEWEDGFQSHYETLSNIIRALFLVLTSIVVIRLFYIWRSRA